MSGRAQFPGQIVNPLHEVTQNDLKPGDVLARCFLVGCVCNFRQSIDPHEQSSQLLAHLIVQFTGDTVTLIFLSYD